MNVRDPFLTGGDVLSSSRIIISTFFLNPFAGQLPGPPLLFYGNGKKGLNTVKKENLLKVGS
jgi:hypothetical protein